VNIKLTATGLLGWWWC